MVEFATLLTGIRRKPGAYGLSGSYREYVAFLNGCDEIQDGGVLAGLSEWLSDELGKGSNLVWWELVRQIAVSEHGDGDGEVEEYILVGRMFELLETFSNQRRSTES